MELYKATEQWRNRPDDERFASISELHTAVSQHRSDAAEITRPYSALSVTSNGPDVTLVGQNGNGARFTHYAFGQLCARIEAPASYLRTLPAETAASLATYGMRQRADGSNAALLMHKNGGLVVRAFTSEKYTRIWNADVTERLLRLQERGPWQPAPAAFDGSRGLYASDHDMFAFLVDNERRIFESGPEGGLSRGFFVWNSEVGAASFGLMTFLYQYVCGNHIVWGASQVRELRIRHIGDADGRATREMQAKLREYADSAASLDEARITRAMAYSLGTDKQAALDSVFTLRVPVLSQARITRAYDLAEQHADWYGSPRSAWGMANGLTQLSQESKYADDRVAIDRAASRVLDLAF